MQSIVGVSCYFQDTRNRCLTSSTLRVLVSEFWVSGSRVPHLRLPVPGSWVEGFRVPGLQVPSRRILSPNVPGLDFRLCRQKSQDKNVNILRTKRAFQDIINPYNSLLKNTSFSIKISN